MRPNDPPTALGTLAFHYKKYLTRGSLQVFYLAVGGKHPATVSTFMKFYGF